MYSSTNLNDLAAEIYAQNVAVGWWDDPNRCLYQTLQLVSTEIAEATEGERKDLYDDHLPHRKMGEVELADALIRLLDLGGRYEWEYAPTGNVHPAIQGAHAVPTIGGKHFFLNAMLCRLGVSLYYKGDPSDTANSYSFLIDSLIETAIGEGYDVLGALFEKLEYNKNRADHKRENRAKPGGKSF